MFQVFDVWGECKCSVEDDAEIFGLCDWDEVFGTKRYDRIGRFSLAGDCEDFALFGGEDHSMCGCPRMDWS